MRACCRWATLGALTVTVVASITVGALASEASRRLTREGLEQLRAGEHAAAMTSFEYATRADPKDAEAHFFFGVGFNRTGKPGEALTWIRRARVMGYENPALDLEEGAALIGLDRFEAALAPLERYAAANPDHGRVRELIGRARFGLGQYDQAEQALKAGLERDPALADTSNLLLALIAARREEKEAPVEFYLRDVLARPPGTPLARIIHERAGPPAPALARPEKPWQLALSVGGGYNSNVVALGDGIPLPVDISSEDGGFGRATIDGSYQWRLTERDILTAGYALQADVYGGSLDRFDLLDQFFYGDLRHRVTGVLDLGLRLSDEYTRIGGRSFRNQASFRPSLLLRLTPWAATELAYTFSAADYYFTTPAAQDRDGTTHTIAVTGHLALPGTRLTGRIGYFFTGNRADGNDFDFGSHGFTVGASHPLPFGGRVDVAYFRTFDDYDNANSVTGLTIIREDEVDRLSAMAVVPLIDAIELYLRYDFTNDDSNIAFFNYDQHVVSAGLIARF